MTVRFRPVSTDPHILRHAPFRWLVTMAGMRLASIRIDMMANSPDFAACVPRLFISTTPGGSHVNGASRSSPALVRKISFRCGAGQGNSVLITLASVTNASASRMPAAKSAGVTPMLTVWPEPMSGAFAATASHIAREKSNSGSLSGFCR